MSFTDDVVLVALKREFAVSYGIRGLIKDRDSWLVLEAWLVENCKGKWGVTMQETKIHDTESRQTYKFLEGFPRDLHFQNMADASSFALKWL